MDVTQRPGFTNDERRKTATPLQDPGIYAWVFTCFLCSQPPWGVNLTDTTFFLPLSCTGGVLLPLRGA